MTLRHRLEAFGLRTAIGLSRRLGPVRASNLGGAVMRRLGPLLRASRTADVNLCLAMPELSPEQRVRIVRRAWENLGRTAAELPHLGALRRCPHGPGWELEGVEHLELLRAQGGPAIFFSAHLGNWELIGPAVKALGIPLAGFYRAASNQQANEIIQGLRRDARGGDVVMFPKGATGARAALAHLRAGGFLGMMMDQKMNDGISVAFFGHDAMTAPALARYALRFHCAIMPIHVVRLGPARFRLVCEAPMVLPRAGDSANDVHAVTLAVNKAMETWIRAAPESWLWQHRRWRSGPSADHANAARA
jgi:Kdo2-lipid IVA lauroyltransferase/acyltransferase